MRVRVVHWNAAEAAPLLATLRAAGHQVEYAAGDGGAVYRAIKQSPPDVVVIDLSRLPSHGRELATGLRGARATRHVPLVFVGGAADKVEAVRRWLPDAVYTTCGAVGAAVHAAKSPAAPVVPPQMMDRYAGRTAAQKLGIGERASVGVIDATRGYAAALGSLPGSATIEEDPPEPRDVTLWFVREPDSFRAALARMRSIAGRTRLWVLWPKQTARPDSGLSENLIRESAMAVGLVDYKVCAIDKTWSALALARRKENAKRALRPGRARH